MARRLIALAVLLFGSAVVAEGQLVEGVGVIDETLGSSRLPGISLSPLAYSTRFDEGRADSFIRQGPGHFWTSGNPAGLPRDVLQSLGFASVRRFSVEGDYRRPLDPAERTRTELLLLGWRPVSGGAVAGWVSTGRGTLGSPSGGFFTSSYTGSPFVAVDTAGSKLRRNDVTVNGAGGWRLGLVSAGIALEHTSYDTRTVEAPAPVSHGAGKPGATLGLTIGSGRWPVTLGAQLRWDRLAESTGVTAVSKPTTVLIFRGLDKPVRVNVASSPFIMRRVRTTRDAQVSLAGLGKSFSWTVFISRLSLTEDLARSRLSSDPPRDLWEVVQTRLNGEGRWIADDGDLILGFRGYWHSWDGDGTRKDLPEPTILGNGSVAGWELLIRRAFSPTVSIESALAAFRDARTLNDSKADLNADVTGWRTTTRLSLIWRPVERFVLSLHGAAARYAPEGVVPAAGLQSSFYQTWLGPGIGIVGQPNSAWSFGTTMHWVTARNRTLLLRVQWRRTDPGDLVPAAGAPDGRRSQLDIEFGVLWGDSGIPLP
jgi:hypothetical protein